MKACTCARDRRALQQLALNVHVKHSDLTRPEKSVICKQDHFNLFSVGIAENQY